MYGGYEMIFAAIAIVAGGCGNAVLAQHADVGHRIGSVRTPYPHSTTCQIRKEQ